MRIELSSQAEKQLRKLKPNRELYHRLQAALDEIASEPDLGKLLGGGFQGVRSLRIGDWRILYEVYRGQMRILVVRIAHRREVYR
jgi:mRNA interferase RelE/StbE